MLSAFVTPHHGTSFILFLPIFSLLFTDEHSLTYQKHSIVSSLTSRPTPLFGYTVWKGGSYSKSNAMENEVCARAKQHMWKETNFTLIA